ncbi:hypothetical protein IY40_10830 [Serratia marcescens]|uniref:hypothetical protein n=1 Tax=Serratia marcescens TaxID=615 RepID=UPI0004E61918|nr:hypothetical protein [Serratia marcescens]KFF79079.1 hypothetical protein IY40_10830 [Serratia marcescens]
MHTPLPNVLDVKTALDAFHFLCLVEGKLMSIRACQRLGLGLEREDPTELNDVENAVINAGEAFGGFLLVMQYGYILTLSANGQALMARLDALSKDIHASYWAQAVGQGKRDVEADIAIGELEVW